MMLKCGQKDNLNYTFGVTDKQIKEAQKRKSMRIVKFCGACGHKLTAKTTSCSKCGSPV